MVKIHQYFIKTFTLLFVATLFSGSLISYFLMETYLINKSKKELENSLLLINYKLSTVDNVDTYIKDIAKVAKLRVTLVESSGKVLAESDYNKADMQNHLNREEIRNLKQSKITFSIRYSATLKRDYIYGAMKSSYRGKKVYLRVALPRCTVFNEFIHIWGFVVLVFTFFILIALYVSYRMSLKVEEDLEQLRLYLHEITDRNYEAVIHIKNYYEFLEISLVLKNMIKKLYTRDKKKNKI